MGYYIQQRETQMRIKAENFSKVVEAINNYSLPDSIIYWNVASIYPFVDIAEAMNYIGFAIDIDDQTGDIIDMKYINDKLGDLDDALKYIAPFVEDGCYIEFSGEEGDLWRYVFSNGACEEIAPEIIWSNETHQPDECFNQFFETAVFVKYNDLIEPDDNGHPHYGVVMPDGTLMCMCCGGTFEKDEYQVVEQIAWDSVQEALEKHL